MTAIEFRNMKIELAKAILNINSEEDIKSLSRIVNGLNRKQPCMYTDDEIRQRADRADEAIQAYLNGDSSRFISHEEIKKKHLL